MDSFWRTGVTRFWTTTCFFTLVLFSLSFIELFSVSSQFTIRTAHAQAGSTYYVATNGDDSSPGTKAAPLKTIQSAVNRAEPGDTIYVRGGTYHENLRISSVGTRSNPIRILAYDNEQPVIDGRYTLPTGEPDRCSDVAPFHCFVYTSLVLINGSHIEFTGFKIVRSRGRGIGVNSPAEGTAQNILIDSCIIDGTRNAGVNIQDAQDVTVQNCDVSHGANFATHQRSASHLNWPVIFNILRSDNVTVRRSVIHESWGEGIAAGRDATNVTIEDNIIYDNHALQVYLHRSQDVLLQRNLVYHTNASDFHRGGNPSECIVINNEDNFLDSLVTARLKVINNVVTGCGRGIAVWGNERTDVVTRDVEITHNIIANSVKNTSATPVGIFVNGRASLRNLLIEKNIVLQDTGDSGNVPVNGQIRMNQNLWSVTPSEGAQSANDHVGDPALRNPNQRLEPGQVNINWFKPKDNSIANRLGVGPTEYLDPTLINTPVETDPNPEPTDPEPAPEPTDPPITTPVPTPTQTPTPGTAPVPPVTDNPSSVDLSDPQLLYRFSESRGALVNDSSSHGEKFDLRIEDSSAVRWLSDGLEIVRPTSIRSMEVPSRLMDACRSSNELSISLWVTPANISQDGPARIVTLSGDTLNRNFTIGQGRWGDLPADLFMARIRTNQTNANGEPDLLSPAGSAKLSKTHVAFVRARDGSVQIYVNGQLVGSDRVPGQFSNWDNSYQLILGNEATGDRPWLGTFHQLAIYCGALTENDVEDLFGLSAELPGSTPDETDFLFGTFIPYVVP